MKHTIIAIAIRQCYAWHGTRIVSAISLPSVKLMCGESHIVRILREWRERDMFNMYGARK